MAALSSLPCKSKTEAWFKAFMKFGGILTWCYLKLQKEDLEQLGRENMRFGFVFFLHHELALGLAKDSNICSCLSSHVPCWREQMAKCN